MRLITWGILALVAAVLPVNVQSRPVVYDIDGAIEFAKVRVVVADIFNTEETPRGWTGSRVSCLAMTAVSLARYRFTFVQGQENGQHVDDFLQEQYCGAAALHPFSHPQYLAIISTCMIISHPTTFFDAILHRVEEMNEAGIAISGHIINTDNSRSTKSNYSLPYMHHQMVIFDAHMWASRFGCPSLGAYFPNTKTHDSFPPYIVEGDVHDNYTPLFLHRSFRPFGQAEWYRNGIAGFMTPFIATSLRFNVSVWNIPPSVRTPRTYGYPMFPENGSLSRNEVRCKLSSLCAGYMESKSVQALVEAFKEKQVQHKLPFRFHRSTSTAGCYDRADFQDCHPGEGLEIGNPKLIRYAPQYLGTNEAPDVFSNHFKPAVDRVAARLPEGSHTHFMTVVGGMNCLNVAQALRPSTFTFFDVLGSSQLFVGRIYLELIMLAPTRNDFVTMMFLRDLDNFLTTNGVSGLDVDNQNDYLSQPIDKDIAAKVLAALSDVSRYNFKTFFMPKLEKPFEFRSFTPIFKRLTKWSYRNGSGNFTVHYNMPGGFLESETTYEKFRSYVTHATANSDIIFADYDLNKIADFVFNPGFSTADNVVIHISNADDKATYLYMDNFEGSIAELMTRMQHMAKPDNVFIISTNGLYEVDRKDFKFTQWHELRARAAVQSARLALLA